MANNQNLGIERGQCSFYRNVRVKENVLMHISEFVNLIRNGKWKNEVSSYRQLPKPFHCCKACRCFPGKDFLRRRWIHRPFLRKVLPDTHLCAGQSS